MTNGPRFTRRGLLKVGAVAGAGAAIRFEAPTLFQGANASASSPQTALAGSSVTQFASPLPTYSGRRVSGSALQVGIQEFQQKVLPDSFYKGLSGSYSGGTWLWGYAVGTTAAQGSPQWPGVSVEAVKGTPTTITYTNSLPASGNLQKLLTIDQTIHWANPLGSAMSTSPYSGVIPTVVHLHGGEDQSTSDGVPEGWFTSNGLHGKGYATYSGTGANSAVYHYPNGQQATTLWFHDHTLGMTRVAVYSGQAAFYLIRDSYDTGKSGNPLGLPTGNYEQELLIADRQFDTNGQLFWPDSDADPSLVDGPPSNPGIHPYWIPEFFGDVMCVNGRAWPYLAVEPRRYRFRFLNGSNARFLRMGLVDSSSGATGPALYQIGSDGGLLDTPVKLTGAPEAYDPTGAPQETVRLFIAPSERADVIIDFSGMAGKKFTLTNDAQVPYPSGDELAPSDPTRTVMQFQVSLPLKGTDTSYNPASGKGLRGGANQEPKIVRLANPATGAVAAGVTVSRKRQLVLFEYETAGNSTVNTADTPVIDLINNSKWNGHRDGGGYPAIPGSTADQYGQGLAITELPRVGSTEIWEFLNITEDAHPIHIHLIEFQLLGRQAVLLDSDGEPTYITDWATDFPGGTYNGETSSGSWGPVTYAKGTIIPGYGPPHDYFTANADGAIGGNRAFGPYLTGPVIPPNPNEAGWKDTIKVFPRYVNRFICRWAPQATAVSGVSPGKNLYSFDPTKGPAYMVHCHILDHEDNEMMRPYIPTN